jgi:TonB family protein
MVPLDSKVPTTPPQPEKVEQAVRPAPALPDLSSVTPFRRTEEEKRTNDTDTPSNLEESLKRTIPTLSTPAPAPKKLQRKTKPIRREPEKSSVPEMSAPQLEPIHPSQPIQPLENPVPREKMSEIMEKLRGEVKVPNLNPSPDTPPFQQPVPFPSLSTKPARSEFDERIARLSIPNVTSVESIKNRLQLLEVQHTSNSGNAASQPSAGTNHYYGMIQDLIQDQWRNTPLVADAPVVVLKFRIARSGEISQIRTDTSSGNGYYDSAARRAVNAVNPLPPFPAEISDSFLDVRFQFIKTDQKN